MSVESTYSVFFSRDIDGFFDWRWKLNESRVGCRGKIELSTLVYEKGLHSLSTVYEIKRMSVNVFT